MIRTVHCSFGPTYYAVCNECKAESDHALIDGVLHSDSALPGLAMPNGWTKEIYRRTPAAQPTQLDYCPRCSVAPEYRRQA